MVNPLGPAGLPELFQCAGLELLAVSHASLAALPALPHSLKKIYADGNALTSLPDLTPSLQFLYCKNNQLTGIDLSGCGEDLKYLEVSGNRMTSLDLSVCTKLVAVGANNNGLASIANIDHLPLCDLKAQGNMLASLPPLPPTL